VADRNKHEQKVGKEEREQSKTEEEKSYEIGGERAKEFQFYNVESTSACDTFEFFRFFLKVLFLRNSPPKAPIERPPTHASFPALHPPLT